MRLTVLAATCLLSVAQCFPQRCGMNAGGNSSDPSAPKKNINLLKANHFLWKAPGPDDIRSPCPVMNTLANHGFVNRNGRNMNRDVVVNGIQNGLGIDKELAISIFETALIVNPTPNATFFDYEMMHRHNVVEHDGSLSRRDAIFDPSNKFNNETFNNFVSYFGQDETISISSIANARARQALDMSLINPGFNITQGQIPVIVGENAMLLAIFGRPNAPIADRKYLEYFFRNERLPVELGWTPSDVPFSPYIGKIVEDIIAQSPSGIPLTFTP